MKRPSRPLRSKSAAATAPALIGSGGSASSGAGTKPPRPSFRNSRGWYSSAPAGSVFPPLVTSRSCRPFPAASKRSTGPSSAAARVARAGASAAVKLFRPRGPEDAQGVDGRPADDDVIAPAPEDVADREAGAPPVEAHGDHLLEVRLVDHLLARLQGEAGGPADLLELSGLRSGRAGGIAMGCAGSVIV